MQVGDVVLAGHQVYQIIGIYLGGVGTENLVGLKSLTKVKGYAHGLAVDEMFVPEDLLSGKVYRKVD